MSRFDDLCASYRQIQQQFVEYREACFTLANELTGGLAAYLEAPEDVVALFARHGQFAGKKVAGPAAAFELGADTYWHFGLVIDVYQEEGLFPYHNVGFDLKLKKLPEKFLLHINNAPAFEIAAVDRRARVAGLTGVFEHLHADIRTRYAAAFAGFFTEGDPAARFGF